VRLVDRSEEVEEIGAGLGAEARRWGIVEGDGGGAPIQRQMEDGAAGVGGCSRRRGDLFRF
jgi:hypothetical protein